MDRRCVHIQSSLSVIMHHARYSSSVFTALWCGCSVEKLTFFFHQTPSWLWLVWTNSPVFIPTSVWTSRHNGTNNAWTPLYPKYLDTCHVCEYPNSTISKVLTVLKLWIITMLNRKLLEKQRVQNHFASYEIGHFLYNVNATVSFVNCLTLSIIRF